MGTKRIGDKSPPPSFAPKEPVRPSLESLDEAVRRGLSFRRELEKRLAPLEAHPPNDRSARCR